MRSNALISLSLEKICKKSSKFFDDVVNLRSRSGRLAIIYQYKCGESFNNQMQVRTCIYLHLFLKKIKTKGKKQCINCRVEDYENGSLPDEFK